MIHRRGNSVLIAGLALGVACSSPNRDLGSNTGSSGSGGSSNVAGASGLAGAGGAVSNAGAAASGTGGRAGGAGEANALAGAGNGGVSNGGVANGGAATSGSGSANGGTGGNTTPSGGAGGAGAGAGRGGASAGGASAAGAGGGGAGAPASNPFIGGPCVTTPSTTSVEVFARGADHNIYRRAISSSDFGSWQSLIGVDGSKLDARSDLDCTSTLSAVHLVGTGINGEFFHALGFGTAYNAFVREFPSDSVGPSAAITIAPSGSYQIAGISVIGLRAAQVNNGTAADLPTLTEGDGLKSAPDLAWQGASSSATMYLAAINTANLLAVDQFKTSSAGSLWQTPIVVNPPTGATFSLSPTICVDSGEAGAGGAYNKHVVVVVNGGNVWYAKGQGSPLTFSAWEQIDSGATSAPDCAVLNDTTVHVVALHSGGKVTDVYGKSGSWAKKDLGTY